MNDVFKKLHSATLEQAMNGNRPTLTTKQFLGKEDGTGYFKSDTLLKFVRTLRPQELEQLEQVVDDMGEGLRIVGSMTRRVDKGGRKYTFVNTYRVNATTGVKFILEQGMTQFLKDYMNGKFILGFTLDQLVEEAMND